MCSANFQAKFNNSEAQFEKEMNQTMVYYGQILTFNRVSEVQMNSTIINNTLYYTNNILYDFAHANQLRILRYSFSLDQSSWTINDFSIVTNVSFSLLN